MLLTAVAWIVVAPFALWAAVRVLGVDPPGSGPQLLAFTPYAAAGAVVVALLALALRRRGPAIVAGVSALALVAAVAPRALGGPDEARAGADPIRVLSLNLHGDTADDAEVVALVRRTRADVLSLQELTPETVESLSRAGLDEVLPHRVVRPRYNAQGNGLYANFPLKSESAPFGTRFAIAAAVGTPRGHDRPVRLMAVHTQAPAGRSFNAGWRSDFRLLPGAREGDLPRILAGDFNATLDHPQMRRLIDTGYEDAADATGKGLTFTWPVGKRYPPLVAIDHVLAPEGSGFGRVSIHDVTGADHRAVFAEVALRDRP